MANRYQVLPVYLFGSLVLAMHVPEGSLHILQVLQRLVLLLLDLPQLQLYN